MLREKIFLTLALIWGSSPHGGETGNEQEGRWLECRQRAVQNLEMTIDLREFPFWSNYHVWHVLTYQAHFLNIISMEFNMIHLFCYRKKVTILIGEIFWSSWEFVLLVFILHWFKYKSAKNCNSSSWTHLWIKQD